ncbi:MAG: hypothetical protein NDJ89_03725 [Oligoflexia bacterium]|nr:hypothetical protein [Oligoflexia bacterium]
MRGFHLALVAGLAALRSAHASESSVSTLPLLRETLQRPESVWSARADCGAYPPAPLPPALERTRAELEQLLRRYAPRIWWHPEERFGPMDPLDFLKACSLWSGPSSARSRRVAAAGEALPALLRKLGRKPEGRKPPAPENLRFEGNYPDFRRLSASELERVPMFWRLSPRQPDAGAAPAGTLRVLLEYWYYSPYNEATPIGIGNHEGDWEGIAMLIELREDARGALSHRPLAGYYAAHEGGAWHCASELDWTPEHPEAFSALGTHATYPTEGRKLALALDHAARGRAWESWRRLLPLELEPYYGFTGRWGPLSALGFMSGPRAPAPSFKARPPIPPEKLNRCLQTAPALKELSESPGSAE